MRLKMPIWQESIKADAGCACELFLIFGSALLQFSLLSRIFTFICIKFKCRSTKFAVKKNGRGIAWNYVVRITCPLCCLPFSHYIINTYRYIYRHHHHKPSACCSYSDLCGMDVCICEKKKRWKYWSLATLAAHHYETNYLAPQYIQLWNGSVAKKCKHI